MNCELVQARLTALLDSELPPDSAAEIERHLTDCSGCTRIRAELLTVKEMASAWGADVPDISVRVMQAVIADGQYALLDEMRLLRAEMAKLRAEVAALHHRLPRTETPWTPADRYDSPKDYPRMENDPWNLIRS